MTTTTSDNADALAPLDQAVAQTGRLIAAIRPDQRHLPTPCHDWDVTELARHLIAHGLPNFTATARGETVDWSAPPKAELGDDWTAAYDSGAAALVQAWRTAAPDKRPRLDQQIAELTVHGWDLARATGTPDAELDDDLAEHSLDWSRSMLKPEHRGPDKAFGAEVPVDDDAAPYERLAAWFGRDPDWTR